MSFNFYFLLHKRTATTLPLVSLILFLFSCSSVSAQSNRSDSEYGISIGTDYDAPVGNFSYTFKPAINYNINILGNYDNFTGSLSLGYHNYKPKQDTFYYRVTNSDYGTIKYQNLPVYSFYLGLAYNLELTEQLKAYGGINMGLYYTHFAYTSSDFLLNDNEDLHEEDLYLAPRLGFTYTLSDHIGIGVEGKYNFFATTGEKRYDDRVGTLYNSYSAGLRLTYSF